MLTKEKAMGMELGTIVKNLDTGDIGVVAMDIMSCCTDQQEPVVYDGLDAFIATDRDSLEGIGQYEAPITDPTKCGLGAGALCCKYLSMEGGDFKCQRFSSLRNSILLKNSQAQGTPNHLYPGCQDDILGAIEEAEI